MQNQIEKLKKFIEIIDGEIFPRKPLKAHIASSLFIPREKPGKAPATAYIHLETSVPLKYLIFLKIMDGLTYVLVVIYYVLFRLSSNPTTKRKVQCEFLKLKQMIRYSSIVAQEKFYFILKRSSFLKKSPDVALLMVAVHEVRHRVQEENTFSNKPCIYDTELSRDYERLYAKQKKFYALRQHSYEPEQELEELDADFIAFTMTAYYQLESGNNPIIDEDRLRIFIEKYRDIMLWKSPAWK